MGKLDIIAMKPDMAHRLKVEGDFYRPRFLFYSTKPDCADLHGTHGSRWKSELRLEVGHERKGKRGR